jgi:hypothetical protein
MGAVMSFLLLSGPAWAMDHNDSRQVAEMQIVGSFLENNEGPVNWVTIYQAIYRLGKKRNDSSKGLLAKILKQDRDLTLIQGVRLPGVMSPLDMIKAAALDALGQLSAYEYVNDMKEVYQKANNKTLRRVAQENVMALGGSTDE